MADSVEPFAFIFEILGAGDGAFYTSQVFCQRGEGPCFAVIANVFIVDHFAQFAGMIVAVAEEFDLLADRYTARINPL